MEGCAWRRAQGERTLLRTIIGGAVVAVCAGLLAFAGGSIGVSHVWPFLLAAGLALAAGSSVASRTAMTAGGALVGIATMGLGAGFLPQTTVATAVTVVLAVVVLTIVAAISQGHLPLWAGLAGYGMFVGLYLPTFEASPTTFLSDAPVALLTVWLALGVGAVIAILADVAGLAPRPSDDARVRAGEVA